MINNFAYKDHNVGFLTVFASPSVELLDALMDSRGCIIFHVVTTLYDLREYGVSLFEIITR